MYRKLLAIALATSLSFYGCGTILKEDRINKPHSNQLDWKIVLLDGIGLIFYVIPGLVAYAVDYSNGTLFLSPSKAWRLSDLSDAGIRAVLEQATGHRISTDQVVELSPEEARESRKFQRFFLARAGPESEAP